MWECQEYNVCNHEYSKSDRLQKVPLSTSKLYIEIDNNTKKILLVLDVFWTHPVYFSIPVQASPPLFKNDILFHFLSKSVCKIISLIEIKVKIFSGDKIYHETTFLKDHYVFPSSFEWGEKNKWKFTAWRALSRYS